jgi:hypothetical protein
MFGCIGNAAIHACNADFCASVGGGQGLVLVLENRLPLPPLPVPNGSVDVFVEHILLQVGSTVMLALLICL